MLQKKYCSWSLLISPCSQYIWPRLLDCSYAADSFSGRGIVVQICSWLLCGWAELLGAFDGMSTIVKLTKAVVFCQTMAELWGWAEHKCCLELGALFFFWCACSLVLLMPRAEQIIYGSSQWVLPWTTAKHIALLHSCTLFIRGSGSKNTTQLACTL